MIRTERIEESFGIFVSSDPGPRRRVIRCVEDLEPVLSEGRNFEVVKSGIYWDAKLRESAGFDRGC